MKLVNADALARELVDSMRHTIMLLSTPQHPVAWQDVDRRIHASAFVLAAQALYRLGQGTQQRSLINQSLPVEITDFVPQATLCALAQPLPPATMALQTHHQFPCTIASAGGNVHCTHVPSATHKAMLHDGYQVAPEDLAPCVLTPGDSGFFAGTLPPDTGFLVMLSPSYAPFPACFRIAVNNMDVSTGSLIFPKPLPTSATTMQMLPIAAPTGTSCIVTIECRPLTSDAMATLEADRIRNLITTLGVRQHMTSLPSSEELSAWHDHSLFPVLEDLSLREDPRIGPALAGNAFPVPAQMALFNNPSATLFDWARSATATITLTTA